MCIYIVDAETLLNKELDQLPLPISAGVEQGSLLQAVLLE